MTSPAGHAHSLSDVLAEAVLPAAELSRLAHVRLRDAGHGYDTFGAHPDSVRLGAALSHGLYTRWFRVESRGHEHIPAGGPVIVAANHSGTLPFDAMMLWADLLRHGSTPRLPRIVADHFVPLVPFLTTMFARWGVVSGSVGNVRHLLEGGELVVLFPEGTVGIGKPFWQRYQLACWRVGHVELSIRYRAPIVPSAVIGAEEQMPQIGQIRAGVRRLGLPYLPLPLTPLPLPVHYHIRYGEPLRFFDRYRPEDADRPDVVSACAAEVKAAVAALIALGRRERSGIFS